MDGLSTNWARAGWLRFLGVPRIVPVCDILATVSAASLAAGMDECGACGKSQSPPSVVQCRQCVTEMCGRINNALLVVAER